MGRRVVQPFTAGQLAEALGCELHGDADVAITGVAPLESATTGDLSFLADPKHRRAALNTAASVLLVPRGDAEAFRAGGGALRATLLHQAPHVGFAEALERLFPPAPFAASVSPLAVIDPTATLSGARIDAFVQIGAQASIGAGSWIGSHCSVARGARIGVDCIIHPGVHIGPDVRLGDRCVVQSGAVIGGDGFGFQPTREGWRKVPQVGTVVIGDDVEIGANTTVDRGAIDDTVIGRGAKIDNLVQIAHNCRIGEDTAIAGCVGIAGSTVIGARCMLGGAAMVNGHLRICDDVIISGGTLVAASIDQPGRYTAVFPITEHRQWLKIAASLRRGSR